MGFLFFSSASPAQEHSSVVLYIFVEDGQAFTREGRELMLDFLKTSLPGKRIALVKAQSRRFFANEKAVRHAVVTQLEKALNPGETVSHLIIATHGSTLKSADQSQTLLQSLGRFDASGADQDLKQVLRPLRGRMEVDAHVILDSCSTMCGTSEEAAARATAFMKEIGAGDGTLYGATNNEVDVRKLGSQARTWEKLKPRWNLLRNAVLTSFALGVPLAWFGLDGGALSVNPYIAHGQVTLYGSALMMSMFQYMEPVMIFLYEKMKAINQGRIFVFRKNRLQGMTEISKRIESLERIYHARSCTRVFQ
ncbi:hypothetical protein [Bdellovibrio bacteriovorus]|nr:hypothetical protein [Bdellovibrio bacteriovorus]